jgi:cytohesin
MLAAALAAIAQDAHDFGIFDDGATQPLYTAIEKGDAAKVTALLDAHPDWLNYQCEGCCDTIVIPHPLLVAITKQQRAIVRLLLERGADTGGALERAVCGTDPEIVKLLVARGVPLNPREHQPPLVKALASPATLPMAEMLIRLGADVNHVYWHDHTPLRDCLAHPEQATFLRGRGAWLSPWGTPLHHAAELGDTEAIRVETSLHRDWLAAPDAFGYTPLALAIACAQWEAALQLLDLGAPANGEMHSPLLMAIEQHQPEVVRALLEHGANPNEHLGAADWHARLPLCHAVREKQPEIVRLLLVHGADPHGTEDRLHLTPLHLAVFSLQADITRLLIDAGAPVNARDAERFTPIARLYFFNPPKEHAPIPEAVAVLMTHGGLLMPVMHDPNQRPNARPARLTRPGQFYEPPLAVARFPENWYSQAYALSAMYALGVLNASVVPERTVDVKIERFAQGTSTTVKQTVTPVANPDARALFFPRAFYVDTFGVTCTQETTRDTYAGGISRILTDVIFTNPITQRTVRIPTYVRWTLLHVRAYNDLLNGKLDTEPDIDVRDANDTTPLHLAAAKARPAAVQALLDAGADPNATDVDGWTPLLFAIKAGRADNVKTLLAGGADPRVRVWGAATCHGPLEGAVTPLTLADKVADPLVKAALGQ